MSVHTNDPVAFCREVQGEHLLFAWDRQAGSFMGIVGACLVCGRVPLSCDIDEYNGQMHQFGAGQGYTVCHLCWLDNFPRAMDVGYWDGHWR